MANKLRVVVADDEKTSREIIMGYVGKYCPGLEIIGEASDAKEAVSAIKEHKPDLVFLDVEMPYGNAFDVLEQTESLDFEVIFITAFSDYAIKALNYSAAYYILKPIGIDELIKAVTKVEEVIAAKSTQSNSDIKLLKQVLKENVNSNRIERIVLPHQTGFDIVNANEITRIAGSGNYSDLYLQDGSKKTVSKMLKYFAELEDDERFVRVHKSHIVNIGFIAAYHKGRGGRVSMKDGSEVEVSASRKPDLLKYLGL